VKNCVRVVGVLSETDQSLSMSVVLEAAYSVVYSVRKVIVIGIAVTLGKTYYLSVITFWIRNLGID
jgi:hypothetical protein